MLEVRVKDLSSFLFGVWGGLGRAGQGWFFVQEALVTPRNPKPLNPKPLNPKPLNPKPLNPKA